MNDIDAICICKLYFPKWNIGLNKVWDVYNFEWFMEKRAIKVVFLIEL